jgi:F-type H+-transporting ATPase subunit delta
MLDLASARKYSTALFDAAKEANQLLACQQGLHAFVRIMKQRETMPELLAHPTVTQTEKNGMLRTALGEFATPLLERFLSLLVSRGRVALVPLIAQEFQEEIDRHQGVQPLKVRSAFPLSEVDKRTIQERLEAWLQSKVRVTTSVDPELIGGMVIETRDYVLDQSFKGQLAKLRQRLAS